MEKENTESICTDLPSHLSTFVDTFIDFCVSGLFLLPPNPNPNPNPPDPLRLSYPSPARLIAIGDLHGDLNKSKQAFRLAGLINSSDTWIGGNTTVVQIGDVLDRGGEELKLLYFLEKLKREASRCGGTIITMNGNHEIMNVDGDFRFVTPSAFHEFKVWSDWFKIGMSMKTLGCLVQDNNHNNNNVFGIVASSVPPIKKEFQEGVSARIAALRPNGPISTRFLSNNPTALVIGQSVFVHGGLLQDHVSYGLDKINEEVRDWINGLKGKNSPNYLRGKDSLVWLRKFSDKVCDCSTLQHVLATIPGAKRMIMGHTIQMMGINGACNNQAIRIDVGMSRGCGDGLPEVLEILGDSEPRILTSKLPLYSGIGDLHPALNDAKKHQKEGLGLLMREQGPTQIPVQA